MFGAIVSHVAAITDSLELIVNDTWVINKHPRTGELATYGRISGSNQDARVFVTFRQIRPR